MNSQEKNVKVSFNGIEEAVSSFPKLAEPGIAVYEITGTQVGASSKGTPYLRVAFVNKEAFTKFGESFFLSQDALPRLKHLLIKTGITMDRIDSIVDTDGVEKALVGKFVRLLVRGEITLDPQGEEIIYPKLGFGAFAENPAEPTKLRFDSTKHVRPKKPACAENRNPWPKDVWTSEAPKEGPVAEEGLPF